MHYLRAGSGTPPLVFVHGFACSHDDWGLQIERFRRSNEVLACDLRAHGLTPGRPAECTIENYGGDVAALVCNLGLEGSVLIGHSMGCRVILEAARVLSASEHAHRVAGLVLIDGSRAGSGDPQAATAAAQALIEKAGYARFAEDLFRQMFFAPSALGEAIVARALRQSKDFGPMLYPAMARWDASQMDAALAAARMPVLAIQSTARNTQMQRSMLKPGETSPYLDMLKKALPDARIEVIPDTGHFPQLEAAEKVNALIASFASTLR